MKKFKAKSYQFGAEEWTDYDDLFRFLDSLTAATEWNVRVFTEVWCGEWMILNKAQLSSLAHTKLEFDDDSSDPDNITSWELWRQELERLNNLDPQTQP